MISASTQVKLNGIIFTAFQIYCAKHGCETTSEGFRMLIRQLPEFKQLQDTSSHADESDSGNGNEVENDKNNDPVEYISESEPQPAIGAG